MAKIEMVNDVVVPLVVTGVNIGARAYDVSKAKIGIMSYQSLAGILGVGIGYGLQLTSKKPEMAKLGNRLGVASFPAMGVAIYDWVLAATKGTTANTGARTAARTVGIQADPLLQYRKGGI